MRVVFFLSSLLLLTSLASGDQTTRLASTSFPQEKQGRLAALEENIPLFSSLSRQTLAAGELSPYAALARIPHTVLEYQYASGSWLGSRDVLKEHGIEPSITYTSDSAGNPVGGKYPGGFTYCDNIAFNVLVNTEKCIGWQGGYFMISALQRDGVSLSQQNVKNLFTVQQVFGGSETFRFYEMYWEQRSKDERINVKAGRFVAADDFDSSPLYWLYMSRGIDGRPQSLAVDGRFSAPPNAVWASRLKLKLPESVALRAGVYQVTPNSVNGLNWNFTPNDGVMLLAQYEWDPEFFKQEPSRGAEKTSEGTGQSNRSVRQIPGQPVPKGFLGHYWMGGYYSTYEYPQFNSKTKTPGTYAFYWHGDQTLYRPNLVSNEGLVGWSVLTLAPQGNIALIPLQINGGLVYTGLIPGRRNDFTIVGCAYGDLGASQAMVPYEGARLHPSYELLWEAGYRINVTKYSYIQPDLMWINNPAGIDKIPNALVLGFQIGVIF